MASGPGSVADTRPIHVISMDWDGCCAGDVKNEKTYNPFIEKDGMKHFAFPQHNTSSFADVHPALAKLLMDEASTYSKQIVMSGSNRQLYYLEALNSFNNIDYIPDSKEKARGGPRESPKGWSFIGLPQFAEEIGAEFDPILLADFTAPATTITPWESGSTFKIAQAHLFATRFATTLTTPTSSGAAGVGALAEGGAEHAVTDAADSVAASHETIRIEHSFLMDDSKLTLLYVQMHIQAAKFEDQEIVFDFFDDREDIFKELYNFFFTHPEKIPSNIKLRLFHYEAWRDLPTPTKSLEVIGRGLTDPKPYENITAEAIAYSTSNPKYGFNYIRYKMSLLNLQAYKYAIEQRIKELKAAKSLKAGALEKALAELNRLGFFNTESQELNYTHLSIDALNAIITNSFSRSDYALSNQHLNALEALNGAIHLGWFPKSPGAIKDHFDVYMNNPAIFKAGRPTEIRAGGTGLPKPSLPGHTDTMAGAAALTLTPGAISAPFATAAADSSKHNNSTKSIDTSSITSRCEALLTRYEAARHLYSNPGFFSALFGTQHGSSAKKQVLSVLQIICSNQQVSYTDILKKLKSELGASADEILHAAKAGWFSEVADLLSEIEIEAKAETKSKAPIFEPAVFPSRF